MKKILESFINKLNLYLSDGTIPSSMRLYSFIVICTGCICAIGYTIFVCINITKLNLNDAAWIYASLATFIGVGITGKAVQFKNEIKSKTNDTTDKE